MMIEKIKNIGRKAIDSSNDYSIVEKKFRKTTGQNLVKFGNNVAKLAKDPVSIVIPTYIGERLDLVLKNLDKQTYKNFEVIIVDDGSPNNVVDKFKNLNLHFPIKYIKVLKNKGTSSGINTGIISSSANIIVVMDQDMIPSNNFVAKMAVRQQFTDRCLFVGFREMIEYQDYIKNRQRQAKISGDWRYQIRDSKKFLNLTIRQVLSNKIMKEKINLVKKSNYFKKFSNGNTIRYWDLACMVIGHSLCFKKDDAIKSGGFIEHFFVGWGMDDIAFGASMIANGNFVIPAVDWVSYHINHTRYSGSREVENVELSKNLDLYLNKYLTLPVNKLKFVYHKIKKVRTVDNVTYYESK